MRALVVAKAPVAGRVKTRLGAAIGMEAAARVAAAALLDTLAVCAAVFEDLHLALDGDVADAVERDTLERALTGWTIHPQRGNDLGERLAHAHADAAGPGPTVQVGMDTPQVTARHLRDVSEAAATGDAVLGPATDGGWWVLALSDPTAAGALRDVPMSRPDTCVRTRDALTATGRRVRLAAVLRDVDTLEDGHLVAAGLGRGHFATAWRSVTR